MRTLLYMYCLLHVACISSAGKTDDGITKQPPQKAKVLVELFTSQGCSSCPPADNLMYQLARQDSNVIILSFHVDYWDRLGWKDVFSNHDYTVRQQQYAKTLHAGSVYTPQAVVQGQYEMVGSNKIGITNAVSTVRANGKNRQLSANATRVNQTLSIKYSIDSFTPTDELVCTIVQTTASTPVAQGENRGKQLSGYNIVRQMKELTVTSNRGIIEMVLPEDVKSDNAAIVLFVQDKQTKKVTAVWNQNL